MTAPVDTDLKIRVKVSGVTKEEFDEAAAWYETTCKHGEPKNLKAYIEIEARNFVRNVVALHQAMKGAKVGTESQI